MKINSFTVTQADWDKMEKAIIEEATKNEVGGTVWFEDENKFDEWAGDQFWDFLTTALEALGAELE